MQWPHFNGGKQVKSPRQHCMYAGWHSSEMSVGLWRQQSIQCARPLRTGGAICDLKTVAHQITAAVRSNAFLLHHP